MVFFGCALMALRYVSDLRREVRVLEQLRDILELIEGEIQYGKVSLPECFLAAGAQCGTKLGRIFEDLGKQTAHNSRENLREAMERALEGEIRDVLPAEEYRRFFEFAAPMGYADEEMQRKALERSREKLEALLKRRQEEVRGRCRVAWSLGMTGGIFVILFLW